MGSVWHAQSPEVGKVLRTADVLFETAVQIQPSLISCCNTFKQINRLRKLNGNEGRPWHRPISR